MTIELVDLLLVAGGLVAGLMVGLTGMGGALLVTPLLVTFGVPASVAVSSDVVAGAVVKPVGSLVHARHGTVHWGLVLWLSVGSVPGVLVGTLLFARVMSGAGGQQMLKTLIGVVLVVALTATLLRGWIGKRVRAKADAATSAGVPADHGGPRAPVRRVATASIGLLVGLMVGMTSVGSGSLIVTSLLLLYPLLRPSVLVGTDLMQAVPMLAAGAIAHVGLGDVDWRLTIALLLGMLPGVWVGARLSSRYDGHQLRRLLLVVLAATSLRLLGAPSILAAAVAFIGLTILAVLFFRERRENADIRTRLAAEASDVVDSSEASEPIPAQAEGSDDATKPIQAG
jgi:uncharacterized protein